MGPRRSPLPPLLLTMVLAACSPSASPSGQPASHPNVILIIADDFGLDASPCYPVGAEKPEMPNLEKLCAQGVVFDNVWVNPQCTPTRATLLTAQYGFRTGVLKVPDVLADTTSIFDVLRDDVPTPYANAQVGKWHVSGKEPDPNVPAEFGVEHFAGYLIGALPSYTSWDITEDGKVKHTSEYATTFLTDKAIDWVSRQDGPWFLWLAYTAPHWPFHVPPADLLPADAPQLSNQPEAIEQNPRPYFVEMAEALDAEMGRLFNSLDAATRANTTIFFTGDNGTDPEVIQAPFTSAQAKASVSEGGIRVPLVVQGYGVERAGEREDALVNGVDIPATIAQLAGSGSSSFADGVSFMRALSDPSYEGRAFIYSDSPPGSSLGKHPGWAIRDDRYKLIEYDSGEKELFDMQRDPWEQVDLLANSSDPALLRIVDTLEKARAELAASTQ